MANDKAAAAQRMKDECEMDLANAVPALESAISALNTLKQPDITFIKSMKNPPAGIKLVMAAVCVMMGIKPRRKVQNSALGKYTYDYWPAAQKMLSDLKFLDKLKAYDRDNIQPQIMRTIRER